MGLKASRAAFCILHSASQRGRGGSPRIVFPPRRKEERSLDLESQFCVWEPGGELPGWGVATGLPLRVLEERRGVKG